MTDLPDEPVEPAGRPVDVDSEPETIVSARLVGQRKDRTA
jgi:hypothetical protein